MSLEKHLLFLFTLGWAIAWLSHCEKESEKSPPPTITTTTFEPIILTTTSAGAPPRPIAEVSIDTLPTWTQMAIGWRPEQYFTKYNPSQRTILEFMSFLKYHKLNVEKDIELLVGGTSRGFRNFKDDFVVFLKGNFAKVEEHYLDTLYSETDHDKLELRPEKRSIRGFEFYIDPIEHVGLCFVGENIMVISSENRMMDAMELLFKRSRLYLLDDPQIAKHLRALDSSEPGLWLYMHVGKALRKLLEKGLIIRDEEAEMTNQLKKDIGLLALLQKVYLGVQYKQESRISLELVINDEGRAPLFEAAAQRWLGEMGKMDPTFEAIVNRSKWTRQGRIISLDSRLKPEDWKRVLPTQE